MAHPFEKFFDAALKKSSIDENLVTKKAVELIEKGYSEKEVCTVLTKLEKSLIDEEAARIVGEARAEVCAELDEDA